MKYFVFIVILNAFYLMNVFFYTHLIKNIS